MTQQQQEPQNGRVSGQPDSPALYLLAEARRQTRTLRQILERYVVSPQQVAATGGGNRQSRRLVDWPVPGAMRFVVPKHCFGGTYTLAAATALQLLPENVGRLGVQIVNSGSGALTLYLCEANEIGLVACPQIWLSGGGGSWDGLLGATQWCGPINALSAAGTTVTVAEV